MSTTTTLSDRLDTAIHKNPYLSGKKLRFEAEEGKVVLRGNVASYFQKQMAQEAVRQVDGVSEIENELTVSW